MPRIQKYVCIECGKTETRDAWSRDTNRDWTLACNLRKYGDNRNDYVCEGCYRLEAIEERMESALVLVIEVSQFDNPTGQDADAVMQERSAGGFGGAPLRYVPDTPLHAGMPRRGYVWYRVEDGVIGQMFKANAVSS